MPRRKTTGCPSYAESSGSDASTSRLKSPKKSKYFADVDKEEEDSNFSASVESEAFSSRDSLLDDSSSLEDTQSPRSLAARSKEKQRRRKPDEPSRRQSSKIDQVRVSKSRIQNQDATGARNRTSKDIGRTSGSDDDHVDMDKDDSLDLEVGEVFIPKLAALPEGDDPYSDITIHVNTMRFLAELAQNNERPWFQQRELQYQAAKQDFDGFVLELAKVIQSVDSTIPTLPVKDLTFRIYRDIRFSNDQTPYKRFLAAYFSRSGRKGPWAGYYFSLEPNGKTILAAGLWQPPSHDLLALRHSIDSDIERWNRVLEDSDFVQFFHGREGLLKTQDKLKTVPKGFDKASENIELLRLKSFTISIGFTDEEVTDGDAFLEILRVVLEQMEKFVTLLNSIIRPDDDSV